jgi:hypothetical protein
MTTHVCGKQGTHRYTWPGQNEAFICGDHIQKLMGVADAMGLPLQLIPLREEEQGGKLCNQQVKDDLAEDEHGKLGQG